MRVRGSGRELFTRASFLIGLLIGQGHKQGDYSGFQLRVQERGAFGVRRVLILLANSAKSFSAPEILPNGTPLVVL
jgi:hypothetical protein